jgi:hypothetical protein
MPYVPSMMPYGTLINGGKRWYFDTLSLIMPLPMLSLRKSCLRPSYMFVVNCVPF